MRNLNKFIKWVIVSFEKNGRASARKLTVFVSFILLNLGFIVHLKNNVTIQKEYILIYATIVLLGLGYLTIENIVDIIKGRYGASSMFMGSDIFTSSALDRNRVDNPDEPTPE